MGYRVGAHLAGGRPFMHKFSAKKGACQISVYTFICFAVGLSGK